MNMNIWINGEHYNYAVSWVLFLNCQREWDINANRNLVILFIFIRADQAKKKKRYNL